MSYMAPERGIFIMKILVLSNIKGNKRKIEKLPTNENFFQQNRLKN